MQFPSVNSRRYRELTLVRLSIDTCSAFFATKFSFPGHGRERIPCIKQREGTRGDVAVYLLYGLGLGTLISAGANSLAVAASYTAFSTFGVFLLGLFRENQSMQVFRFLRSVSLSYNPSMSKCILFNRFFLCSLRYMITNNTTMTIISNITARVPITAPAIVPPSLLVV